MPSLFLQESHKFTRELGVIFGDGNTNFDTFLHEHECNHFCQFYELPPLKELGAPREEFPLYQPPPRLASLPPSEDDLPETLFQPQKTDTSGTKAMDISNSTARGKKVV